MSAILLVASSHINHYLPKDHPNRRPVLHHFGVAIAGLRKAVSEGINGNNFDSIISCSLLLIHYSWTYIDSDLSDDREISFLFRDTFALFYGLKECVVTVQSLFTETAKWAKTLKYKPRKALEQYVYTAQHESNRWDAIFEHCLFCEEGTNCSYGASADNVSAASRLILLLRAIDIVYADINESGILPDMLRYLFTWPTLCTKGFIQQTQENNPTSLKILFYYYAAILSIYSDEIWWMRDRARLMYDMLWLKLSGRCAECTGPAVSLVERQKIISIS